MISVFISTSANLKVGFPPELFGTIEDYSGKQVNWPILKFVDGSVKLDSETEDSKVIEMLETHTGNVSNGGTDFWMLPQDDTDSMLSMQLFAEGRPVAQTREKDLKSDDKNYLKKLLRFVDKPFAPTQRQEVSDVITSLVTRFDIIGIEKPDKNMKTRSLKAICVRLLDYFEDSGLWKEDDGKGKATTG